MSIYLLFMRIIPTSKRISILTIIIGVNDEVWIVETKGGFDRSGNSQDIDIFTPKKFAVLKDYLDRYRLKGGIVRYDEKSEELCICMDNYSEDINSDSWVVLSDILK